MKVTIHRPETDEEFARRISAAKNRRQREIDLDNAAYLKGPEARHTYLVELNSRRFKDKGRFMVGFRHLQVLRAIANPTWIPAERLIIFMPEELEEIRLGQQKAYLDDIANHHIWGD